MLGCSFKFMFSGVSTHDCCFFVPFHRTAKKSIIFTDESHGSSTLPEVESEDQESSSDSRSESGMASGYTSSSSTSHRESDSPVPTSELSDSSDAIESSSDESSSSEDVLRWCTR